jgi:hypothetical protein
VFTKLSKFSLLTLAVACFSTAALAQGANQTSRVPPDLRAQVLRLGAICQPLEKSLRMTDGCGVGPAAMKLFGQVLKKAPAILRQMKLLYRQGMSLCGQLRPSPSDGTVHQVLVFSSQRYSQADCWWGKTGADHLELLMRVPSRGRTLPVSTCESIPSAFGPVNCSPVPGGVSASIVYTPPHRVGRRIVSTTAGYIDLQRWSSTQTAFSSRQAGDARRFNDVAMALGLPRMSS